MTTFPLLKLSAAVCGLGLVLACAGTPARAQQTTDTTALAADTVAATVDSARTETKTGALRETVQDLKDKAQDLVEDAKADLKESWQDAKESYKEQGLQLWNTLKEKAQEWKEEATELFDTYVKSQVVGKFDDNRRQCNQEFCDHLRGGFKAYKIQTFSPEFPGMPARKAEPDTAWPALTWVVPAGVRSLSPLKAPAAPEPYYDELIQVNRLDIEADGVKVALDLEPRLNTYGIGAPTEKNLAAFWQKLSESRFDIPLRQLYEAAAKHRLNDWGFYRLTQAAAAAIYPKNKNGEQEVWTVFMLNQAGYAAKIGRMGADKSAYRLLVLLPFYEKVYNWPYVEIGGAPFYLMEKLAGKQRNEPVYSYEGCFALGTAPLSLQFRECVGIPCLYEKNDRFAYNLRMLDFYKNYPYASTALYLHAPCGEVLSKSIRHKCAPAVDSLLTPAPTQACREAVIGYLGQFVATYFNDNAKKKAKPDGQPLFPDEAFALKAGDAKDRAILHARLVRRFTDLPVILAEYETTALVGIALPEPPAGAEGQALAAIKGDDGTVFYLFNPNAKDGRFWHCPKPLRDVPPIVVL